MFSLGDGGDSRICSNLEVQIRINLLISSILVSILYLVISFSLFTLNDIPKETNSEVQIMFLSLHVISLLSPHTPILIILVFSILIF